MIELDVCIVNYLVDDLIKLNIEWLKKPGINFIIGENSPYKYKDNSVACINGVDKSLAIATSKNGLPHRIKIGHPKPGNHHSLCLEKCVQQATARFILLLDADYFCLANPFLLIEYMAQNNIAVMGTAYKSSVRVVDNKMRGQSAYYPMTHFCLIDRDIYTEPIILDPRKTTNQFIHFDDIVDTGLPFRQTLYKYKCETFNICIQQNCSLCNGMPQGSLSNDKRKPIERSFFNKELVGLHYHYRGSDTDRIKGDLRQYQYIYHGPDLFLTIEESKQVNYWND